MYFKYVGNKMKNLILILMILLLSFLNFSCTDSFGIVYLEAWLYRKPVIGARTWGVTDVIADGKDGLLVAAAVLAVGVAKRDHEIGAARRRRLELVRRREHGHPLL